MFQMTIYDLIGCFTFLQNIMPGPPFAFGAFLAILALLIAIFIPDREPYSASKSQSRRSSSISMSSAASNSSGSQSQDLYPLESTGWLLCIPSISQFKWFYLRFLRQLTSDPNHEFHENLLFRDVLFHEKVIF